ncbi:hypothetical protein FQN50_007536 [Emmonsiellopsis sp. PD_5]|nr:hypothetical protein FQN50_007536 [Emmonsiellopsis sp. PD_5]
MPPTSRPQRKLAGPLLPQHIYIIIPLSLLISIVLIKRIRKARLNGSLESKQKYHPPSLTDKNISSDYTQGTAAQCTTSTMMPYRQPQRLGPDSSCSILEPEPSLKIATQPPSHETQIQPQNHHAGDKTMTPPQQSPLSPDFPRTHPENQQTPFQIEIPAPHWQTEEVARPADETRNGEPHPYVSPVMQNQPVDFPQIQRETVQFLPRAGPDKRQVWRRRILECN